MFGKVKVLREFSFQRCKGEKYYVQRRCNVMPPKTSFTLHQNELVKCQSARVGQFDGPSANPVGNYEMQFPRNHRIYNFPPDEQRVCTLFITPFNGLAAWNYTITSLNGGSSKTNSHSRLPLVTPPPHKFLTTCKSISRWHYCLVGSIILLHVF